MKKLILLLILTLDLNTIAYANELFFVAPTKEGFIHIGPGQTVSFKVCADKETADLLKIHQFPTNGGYKFSVKFTWHEYNDPLTYAPWNQEDSLPMTTVLTGPLPGGNYCSPNLVIKYSHFYSVPVASHWWGDACPTAEPPPGGWVQDPCRRLNVYTFKTPQELPPPLITKPPATADTIEAGSAKKVVEESVQFGSKAPQTESSKPGFGSSVPKTAVRAPAGLPATATRGTGAVSGNQPRQMKRLPGSGGTTPKPTTALPTPSPSLGATGTSDLKRGAPVAPASGFSTQPGIAAPQRTTPPKVTPSARVATATPPKVPELRATPAPAARRAPTADLEVTKVYNDSGCNLWATITNTGKSAINANVADAYWHNGQHSGGGGVALNLAPGQSTNKKLNAYIPIGSYENAKIKYRVDTNNALIEKDENNNEATATLTCKMVLTPGEPTPPSSRDSRRSNRLTLPSR